MGKPKLPDFSDKTTWHAIGEYWIIFDEATKGTENSSDWGLQGCKILEPEKRIEWRRIGWERRYCLRESPEHRAYETFYFNDDKPQFVLWPDFSKDNNWIFAVNTCNSYQVMPIKEIVLSAYQHEIKVQKFGKVIQQIYFLIQKVKDGEMEYIFKENPRIPAAKLIN